MKAIEKLEDCSFDAQNPNEGTLRGSQLLERSMETHGAGRPIVVDRNGVAVAGNKTLESAVEHGLKAMVVDTDGHELVVVQRVDLDLRDNKTRELAYLDNRVSEVGLKWNPTQLEDDLARGIELGGMFSADEREEILKFLDQAEVRTRFKFDTVDQMRQFEQLVAHIEQHFLGDTFGAKLTQWVLQQLADIDPVFSPGATQ